MASADQYAQMRDFYGSKSTNISLAATDAGKPNVISPRNSLHTIFIQKVHYNPTVVAAQTVTIQDDGGANLFALVPASQALPVPYDFGPDGRPAAQGASIDIVNTAGPGAAIVIEAYEKLTGVGAA